MALYGIERFSPSSKKGSFYDMCAKIFIKIVKEMLYVVFLEKLFKM